MKKNRWILILILAAAVILMCFAYFRRPAPASPNSGEVVVEIAPSKASQELRAYLEADPELMALMEKSLSLAAEVNPDPNTNPVRTVEEFYRFIDWSVVCMPWNVLTKPTYPTLYESIDQSIDYVWFLLDQPMEELEGKGYFYPSLEYHEPICGWLTNYANEWGDFLNTEESWNDEYYEKIKNDPSMNMQRGWYADTNVWHTFNEWFSRHLKDPSVRPIADSTVVSPADAKPQGTWKIDEDGNIIYPEDLIIKSNRLRSVQQLIKEESEYANAFGGGILTHTFLDVNDYHRYHCPVSGTILEVRKIPFNNCVGGVVMWDPDIQRYILSSDIPEWQMIETRDCVIIDTGEYGLVAVLPVGMSQICSCNWEDTIQPGAKVNKGDPLGYFLFGGSDIIMIFQSCVDVEYLCKEEKGGYAHILMGEPYANLIPKESRN